MIDKANSRAVRKWAELPATSQSNEFFVIACSVEKKGILGIGNRIRLRKKEENVEARWKWKWE